VLRRAAEPAPETEQGAGRHARRLAASRLEHGRAERATRMPMSGQRIKAAGRNRVTRESGNSQVRSFRNVQDVSLITWSQPRVDFSDHVLNSLATLFCLLPLELSFAGLLDRDNRSSARRRTSSA